EDDGLRDDRQGEIHVATLRERNPLLDDAEKRIGESEEHRETHADDERRVDEAEEQENLALQLRHELGLARSAFQEAARHDADADASAQRTQPDHEADADARVRLDLREHLKLVHSGVLSLNT